jgi:hypothetical protein
LTKKFKFDEISGRIENIKSKIKQCKKYSDSLNKINSLVKNFLLLLL